VHTFLPSSPYYCELNSAELVCAQLYTLPWIVEIVIHEGFDIAGVERELEQYVWHGRAADTAVWQMTFKAIYGCPRRKGQYAGRS
jgi:hypothetical protein